MALTTRRQFLQQTAFAAAAACATSSRSFANAEALFSVAGPKSSALDPNTVRALASKINGRVITPQSSDYESARLVFNRAFDEHPALIVRCAGPSDIARSLEFSQTHKLRLAVRSGGHSRAGFGVCEGGMVIDVGGMNRVEVDREKRIARVQAGALVRDMDQATRPAGLATTSGGCPGVGLAGYTLGGGEGLLMSMFGAGCDNLLSAGVMTVDGRELEASPKSNADLFWAIRGGGGNFGIATQFEYQLHPMGEVLAGALTYPAGGRIPELLQSFAKFVAAAPDEMVPLGELLQSDKGPAFINHICYVGDAARGNDLLKPLRALKPYDESLKAMSYWDAQAAGFKPPPAAHFQTNVFLPQLNDAAIAAIASSLTDAPPSFRVLMVPFYGAITRVPLADTAFPLRETGHELDIQCRWNTPDEKVSAVRWVTALRDSLRPFSRGVYVNQTTERTPGLAREAYGSNYARLAEIKKKYDPTNVLRLNQNIIPS